MANNPPLLKESQKPKKEQAKKIGWWRNKCDTAMQVKGTKENPNCEICGKPVNCMHHFYPKSVSARLRYDWDNLIPICQGCHSRHHQAGDPRIHGTVIQKRGMGWYERLLEKKKEEIKVNIGYYKEVLAQLTQ